MPPTPERAFPFARTGARGDKAAEGKGEGRGHERERRGHSGVPALGTGDSKVKFGNQTTGTPRVLFSSAAPKYLFLKCCKWQAASSANIPYF